jgi:methionine biosynthesis protein MetW
MTKEIGQNIVSNHIRYDLEIIANLIKRNSKVLDIGCGEGELLYFLKKNKNVDGRGLEILQEKVSKSLARGLSVIQGNAEDDLSSYPNQSFDYTVLSQTLQATHKPKEVLEEMLRISKFAIVSLPNFAHIKNRLHLLFKGTMPVNKNIPFEWFETPNIHFCSIRDFEKLCNNLHFNIDKKIFLTARNQLPPLLNNSIYANIFAEYGIFLITKKEFLASAQEEFAFRKSAKIAFKPATCGLSIVNNSKE